MEWSPYDSRFETADIGGTIRDNRGDALKVEYQYDKDESESIYSRLDLTLTDEIKTFFSLERNLLDQETIETRAGLKVEKPCWTFSLFYSEADDDKSITFLVNLHGIGAFGTR